MCSNYCSTTTAPGVGDGWRSSWSRRLGLPNSGMAQTPREVPVEWTWFENWNIIRTEVWLTKATSHFCRPCPSTRLDSSSLHEPHTGVLRGEQKLESEILQLPNNHHHAWRNSVGCRVTISLSVTAYKMMIGSTKARERAYFRLGHPWTTTL